MNSKNKTTGTKDDVKAELVPKLRFPEFVDTEGWESKRLGSVGELTRGLTYSSADVASAGLLVLRSTNIQDGSLVLDKDLVFVGKPIPGALRLQAGDIVICMSNGSKTLVGKSSEYFGEHEGDITVGAFCSFFRPRLPFAKFAFHLGSYQAYIANLIAGGSINNLTNFVLEEFIFHPAQDVVLPTRLMGLLGAKVLFLTNAAGGTDFTMNPGDLMIIRDQIASFVPSPLIGKNIDELGVRFPDMSRIYDLELCNIIRNAAAENAVPVKEGVYCQLSGPQFESPAEVRMVRGFGANAVGMSTAIEAVAARHMGMRVCGISCISNLACGMTNSPLTSEEVNETAQTVEREFTVLVTESIRKIGLIL